MTLRRGLPGNGAYAAGAAGAAGAAAVAAGAAGSSAGFPAGFPVVTGFAVYDGPSPPFAPNGLSCCSALMGAVTAGGHFLLIPQVPSRRLAPGYSAQHPRTPLDSHFFQPEVSTGPLMLGSEFVFPTVGIGTEDTPIFDWSAFQIGPSPANSRLLLQAQLGADGLRLSGVGAER